MGEPLSATDSDLADVLEQAEAVIKRHDDLSQRRGKLETKLATARAERATAELSLQTAEAELTTWRIEWSAMMARIGLEADATPEQAEVFLTKISELLEKLNDRRNTSKPDSRHRPRRRRLRAGRHGAGGSRRSATSTIAQPVSWRGTGPTVAGRTGRRPAMHHADQTAAA